jgi:hypothetical protein
VARALVVLLTSTPGTVTRPFWELIKTISPERRERIERRKEEIRRALKRLPDHE